MDLPSHYFPVHVCPHIGEAKHHRLMFADQGSHKNVNISVDEENTNIKFWPQAGQRSMQNLSRAQPSIPLFDHPLHGNMNEKDQILGVTSFSDTLNRLVYVVRSIPRIRGFIRRYAQCGFAKKFKACKGILQKISQETISEQDCNLLPLKETMEGGLQMVCDKYMRLREAHNDNCLIGFNRDFSGGLISSLDSGNGEPGQLIHAGGPDFKHIYMTEMSEDPKNELLLGKVMSQISVEDPVFQIVTSPQSSNESLICARQKHKCLYLCGSKPGNQLQVQDCMEVENEILSSVSCSPYLGNEVLSSSTSGSVYLWDVGASSRRLLLEKCARFECPDKWSSSYFGGHPRHIVVADNTSVEMFDHRSHFCDGIELFALSYQLIKKDERVMAAAPLGFPYHVIATDYSVFVIDQRFGSAPVLQWSPEFVSAPQYVQVLQQQKNQTGNGKLLFLASQQPAEVMCFSASVSSDSPPVSPVLPWKVSSISDFYQLPYLSYHCDSHQVERRFETSLAGIAVSSQSTRGGFCVYQMDAQGDIFYQRFNHDRYGEFNQLQSITASERQSVNERSSRWLKAFDATSQKNHLQASQCEKEIPVVSVGSIIELLKDTSHSFKASSEEKELQTSPISSPSSRPVLHRRLKGLDKLPNTGSSTQLHLMLKDNRDIKEILLKREADHMALRKTIREKNLKKKESKKSPQGRYKSKRLISISNSSSDDDDNSNDKSDQKSHRHFKRTLRPTPAKKLLKTCHSSAPEETHLNQSQTGELAIAQHGSADDRPKRTGMRLRSHKHTPVKAGKSNILSTQETPSEMSQIPQVSHEPDQAETPTACPEQLENADYEKNTSAIADPSPEKENKVETITGQHEDPISQSGRLLSRFTKSKAKKDDSTSLSSTATLPFSVNQNLLRRAFSKHAIVKSVTDDDNQALSSTSFPAADRLQSEENIDSSAKVSLTDKHGSKHTFFHSDDHSGQTSGSAVSSFSGQDRNILSEKNTTDKHIKLHRSAKQQKIANRKAKKLSKIKETREKIKKTKRIRQKVTERTDHQRINKSRKKETKPVWKIRNLVPHPQVQRNVTSQSQSEKLREVSSGSQSSSHSSSGASSPVLFLSSSVSNSSEVPTMQSNNASHLMDKVQTPTAPSAVGDEHQPAQSSSFSFVRQSQSTLSTCLTSQAGCHQVAASPTSTTSPNLNTQIHRHKENQPITISETQQHSPLHSSNAGVGLKEKSSTGAVSTGLTPSPHHHVLSWLLHSSQAQSKTSSQPGSPIVRSHTNSSSISDQESRDSSVRRRLAFSHSSTSIRTSINTFKDNVKSPLKDSRKHHGQSDSSESDSDLEESDCSSLPASMRNTDFSAPAMRRLVDPSLAGFLNSPLRQGKSKLKTLSGKKKHI